MNTGPSDGRRRSSASLTMYDPARDIFTTPEDLHRATPNEAHPGDNQQAKVAQPSQADDVQDKDGASTAPPVEQTFPSRANDGGPVSSKLDASVRDLFLSLLHVPAFAHSVFFQVNH